MKKLIFHFILPQGMASWSISSYSSLDHSKAIQSIALSFLLPSLFLTWVRTTYGLWGYQAMEVTYYRHISWYCYNKKNPPYLVVNKLIAANPLFQMVIFLHYPTRTNLIARIFFPHLVHFQKAPSFAWNRILSFSISFKNS